MPPAGEASQPTLRLQDEKYNDLVPHYLESSSWQFLNLLAFPIAQPPPLLQCQARRAHDGGISIQLNVYWLVGGPSFRFRGTFCVFL